MKLERTLTQIDVFVNTETEVTSLAEVLQAQLVFLDLRKLIKLSTRHWKIFVWKNLQSLLEDFHGLGTTNGAVDGDLFVSSDTEPTNGQAG